ncbi:uncharacterized protein B0I36DRAFT_331184 [Microdochium trichocladiopsis]|uniref:Uncharacterized protein n=1 Tax=Microdochium trichocladiopsis TaxID=1682393 RepID=A0A9P8Y386_9PEZI|nr:uncharacterized protein B0I36DRAFT_331184 [Microdochium trichocladiopsis]KAH7026714.1 hypothetical protein B0I36DRAFT_331184 [Microdochium trichocladiopsis]
MPIDYSKWDSIDMESEDDAPAPPAPVRPTPPVAASASNTKTSPRSTSSTTASSSSDAQAVILCCKKDQVSAPPWSATTIPTTHPVFDNPVPPVPDTIKIPLVFHRLGTVSNRQVDLDNQIATYINIDGGIGFAPPEWQSHVGSVIVARQDRKALLPHHLEGVWMYCDHILDLFGERGGQALRELYSKQAFAKWWDGYCEEQKGFRLGTGGEKDPDEWSAVRSPYEV